MIAFATDAPIPFEANCRYFLLMEGLPMYVRASICFGVMGVLRTKQRFHISGSEEV